MHKNNQETITLLEEIISKKAANNTEIVVAPTFVNLLTAVEKTNGKGITVAAQNMHQAEGGAFTGEISANISKLKGVVCVNSANPATITAPPKSIYKLLCADEIPNATLLAVNIVVVNEQAAKNPNNIPIQSISIEEFNRLVANNVPIRTIITAKLFCFEWAFLSKNHSNKTPIQTDCISIIIAIETSIYFTHK